MKSVILGLMVLMPSCQIDADLESICDVFLFAAPIDYRSEKYLADLGRRRCLVTLFAIQRKHLDMADRSATAICQSLDLTTASAYCSTLDRGSVAWNGAMQSLTTRPKGDVMDCLLTEFQELNQWERAYFYQLFSAKAWPELTDAAVSDISNTTEIIVPNGPFGVRSPTIGEYARSYLDRVNLPHSEGQN